MFLVLLVLVDMASCADNVTEGIIGDLTGNIIGGVYADVHDFPHSAYLVIECSSSEGKARHRCGSSIINQYFLVSAAHCFEECYPIPKSFIGVSVGSHHIKEGISHKGAHFQMHPDYNSDTVDNDISIVRLSHKLRFTKVVKRVAIMTDPPYDEAAEIAGWGLIDEVEQKVTSKLKSTKQAVITRKSCLKILHHTPQKTICAGYKKPKGKQGYVAEGDSGSGLVVRKYILIGIVSYKLPKQSKSISIFTEVGAFMKWIKKTTARSFCSAKGKM